MDLLSGLLGGTPRDRFARTVMKRLKALGWTGPEPEYDAEHFSLRFADGAALFLPNAFAAWSQASGADKQAQIDITLGWLLNPVEPKSLAEASPHLLPAVRSRAALTNAWLEAGEDAGPAVQDGAMRPMCDDLAIIAAIDTETSIAYVSRETLGEWGSSFDQVFEIALENLRAISPCKFVRDPGGFWISDYGDHHDAARLLLPHLFGQLDLAGDPVAVALDRAGIVVTGSEDISALAAMADYCNENFLKTDRPISCLPIVHQGDEWRRFSADRPELLGMDRLRVRQSVQDYYEQRALLESWCARQGLDVYVADLGAGGLDGRSESYATWTQDVDTLLPRADVVAFARPVGDDHEYRPRLWPDVEAEFGPFTPEPYLYPPRYRVRAWPDDAWARAEHLAAPDWADD